MRALRDHFLEILLTHVLLNSVEQYKKEKVENKTRKIKQSIYGDRTSGK